MWHEEDRARVNFGAGHMQKLDRCDAEMQTHALQLQKHVAVLVFWSDQGFTTTLETPTSLNTKSLIPAIPWDVDAFSSGVLGAVCGCVMMQ